MPCEPGSEVSELGHEARAEDGGYLGGFPHDALGNLRSVTLLHGTAIEYLVDGENRRVGKKVDGVLVQGWLQRWPP